MRRFCDTSDIAWYIRLKKLRLNASFLNIGGFQDIYHRGCAYYTVLQKFKGLECTVLPMVGLRCTIENPKIIRNNSRTYS